MLVSVANNVNAGNKMASIVSNVVMREFVFIAVTLEINPHLFQQMA